MRSGSDDWFWLSPFVFSAEMRRRRAVTFEHLQPSELDAVVAVRELFRVPPAIIDFTGREITLRGHSAGELKIGARGLFAAEGWIYGDSLALIEVGRMTEGEARNARRRIEDAEIRAAEDAMESRLGRADLIVLARVEKAEPRGGEERPPVSEHDPVWWDAFLRVESVEKGKAPRQLRILFPRSDDEYWYESPKFARGDEGVFLLQDNQQERGPQQYRVRAYTALDPLDFQPKDRLDEIRRLLKRR